MYTYQEPYKIGKIEIITAGTTAVDFAPKGRMFMLQNHHASNTVYFKNKTVDGLAATATNGYILYAKETTMPFMSTDTISILASAGSTSVAVIYLLA